MAVIKAMVDSIEYVGKSTRRDIVIESLKRHPWIAQYFRCAYSPGRFYIIDSTDCAGLPWPSRSKEYISLFSLLTKLQFFKLSYYDSVRTWMQLLRQLPEELRPIANMILDGKIGRITFKLADRALKETNNFPFLWSHYDKELAEARQAEAERLRREGLRKRKKNA